MPNPSVSTRKIHWSPPLLEQDDQEAAIAVIKSGWMTQGKNTEAFEKEIAEVCGAKHAVVVNNGTSALITALLVSGIKPDDEVLAPTYTFIATINAILAVGAKPILVDCDRMTLNITPDLLKAKLTKRTKAILFVDVFGMPCDYEALQAFADAHKLILIEDGAQALGATYRNKPIGSFAHTAIMSFHMAKLVSTVEGGCVLTQNDEVATAIHRIRNHGMAGQYHYVVFGLNLRITDIQSAIGRSQLKKLPRILAHRTNLVQKYKDQLGDIVCFQEIPSYVTQHPHMIFSIMLKNLRQRDELNKHLNQNGVDTRICWVPTHKQPYHQPLFALQGAFPNSEWIAERTLSLPLGNALVEEEVDYVISVAKEGLRSF